MILILDNIINNYLNITSLLFLVIIFYLNKDKLFIIFLIDLVLNRFPLITIIIVLFYYLNKVIFKFIINNNINKIIILCLYSFLLMTAIYIINNYDISYFYYIKTNIITFIFNGIIYYLYINYKNVNSTEITLE